MRESTPKERLDQAIWERAVEIMAATGCGMNNFTLTSMGELLTAGHCVALRLKRKGPKLYLQIDVILPRDHYPKDGE